MGDRWSDTGRPMVAGAVIAVLLLAVVGIGFWLALTTGGTFEIALAVVVLTVIVAIAAGYFTAGTSTIIGFATRWKADLDILFPPPTDEDNLLRDTRWTRDAFLWVAVAGVAAMFIYALQWKPAGFATVFGSALMVALAALGSGIFLGFLFAIPRTLQESVQPTTIVAPSAAPPSTESLPASPPALRQAASPAVRSGTFGVNTNLEQISDWLTKIIVGLGLINLDKLPSKVRSFVDDIAPSVGGQYGFALAILGSYSVCGFMLGYLLTRLYLTRAFTRVVAQSEQEANAAAGIRKVIDDVAAQTPVAIGAGSDLDPISAREKVAAVRVERLAEKAATETLWKQVDALAREYEAVRSAMNPGPPRTKAMEVVATKMRTIGPACYDLLPSLALSLSPGQRLAAISFLEARPNREYLEWLAGRFSVDMPFLLFHAAWALRHAARGLPVADLDAVDRALDSAIATMSAHPSPDRNALDTLNAAKAEVAKRRATG